MPKLSEDAITSAKVTIGEALDNPTYQELPDDLSRAARIKVDFNLSASVVADHFQINKSKLARAVRSLEEGRAIGKMGRPTSLTEKGEQELLEAVKQIANQDQSTRPAFLSEVRQLLLEITLRYIFIKFRSSFTDLFINRSTGQQNPPESNSNHKTKTGEKKERES